MSTRVSERRVSVVIPTYNRRERVCRAVESVLAQTRPADEILVVDDGSDDGTPGELERRFGSAVRVLTEENAGVAAARNLGIRSARYELIAFLDSDDIWHPRKLERQLPTLDDSAALSVTNWAWRGSPDQDAFRAAGRPAGAGYSVDPQPLAAVARGGRALYLVQTAIARKSQLLRMGLFDERLRYGEDTRLLLRLALEGPFAVLGEPLLIRDEGDGVQNLSQRDDYAARRERNRTAVEMLLEAYARAGDAPWPVQRGLRRLLAYHLGFDARLAAEDGRLRLARQRALESLVYAWSGRTALRCAVGLVAPRLLGVRKPWGRAEPAPPGVRAAE